MHEELLHQIKGQMFAAHKNLCHKTVYFSASSDDKVLVLRNKLLIV